MSSIASLLKNAALTLAESSDSASLDAEILLCVALDKPRSHLRAWPDRQPEPELAARFHALVRERRKGIPIAYLTGQREFWSREFHVSPDVLIPRPETERLIELSLAMIPKDKPARILDLGTGSGIIAVTLAAELPTADVTATDVSPAALAVARRNAGRHGVKNIRFYQGDWFAAVPEEKFDLIVSNPPYIAEENSHLRQGDLRFEPQTALSAPRQGLADIQTIAETARQYLHAGGHLLIEHGYDQRQAVQSIFNDLGYDSVKTYKDLSGQPRVTYGRY